MNGFMVETTLYNWIEGSAWDCGSVIGVEKVFHCPTSAKEIAEVKRNLLMNDIVNAENVGDGVKIVVKYYDPDDDTYNSPEEPWPRYVFSFHAEDFMENYTEKPENKRILADTISLGTVVIDGNGHVVYSMAGEGVNRHTIYPYRASKLGGWDNCSGRYSSTYLARLIREGKAKWA